jgi:uncharacterized protein YdcH (DUF465 family)
MRKRLVGGARGADGAAPVKGARIFMKIRASCLKMLRIFDAYQGRLFPEGVCWNPTKALKEETKMSHTPHDLVAEFPEYVEKLRALKGSDKHFAKLAEDYASVNKQVYRSETNIEPIEHLAEEQLRKQRAFLKDEIYALLRA